ncbi:MAG TPA: hypothetical protein VN695_19385 [Streptosporangiaceae bacterium]|nr:hypothetical protein [Streptosporangiaceae bacterium]
MIARNARAGRDFVASSALRAQGTFLDGIDRPQGRALRKEGTEEMLDGLTGYLAARA